MSNTDKLREIAFKWGCRTIPSHDFTDDKYEDKSKELLSDLTALISEDYVEKAKYDYAVRQRDELREVVKSLIDWDRKFPIAKIYNYNEAEELETDITSIVKAAKAAIKNTER